MTSSNSWLYLFQRKGNILGQRQGRLFGLSYQYRCWNLLSFEAAVLSQRPGWYTCRFPGPRHFTDTLWMKFEVQLQKPTNLLKTTEVLQGSNPGHFLSNYNKAFELCTPFNQLAHKNKEALNLAFVPSISSRRVQKIPKTRGLNRNKYIPAHPSSPKVYSNQDTQLCWLPFSHLRLSACI